MFCHLVVSCPWWIFSCWKTILSWLFMRVFRHFPLVAIVAAIGSRNRRGKNPHFVASISTNFLLFCCWKKVPSSIVTAWGGGGCKENWRQLGEAMTWGGCSFDPSGLLLYLLILILLLQNVDNTTKLITTTGNKAPAKEEEAILSFWSISCDNPLSSVALLFYWIKSNDRKQKVWLAIEEQGKFIMCGPLGGKKRGL